MKGFILSLVAGALSAVYGFALEVAAPVADLAERHGAGIWKGNVAYLFANTGAFVTALAYSLYLARRNRSLGELVRLSPGKETKAPSPESELPSGTIDGNALVRAVLLL